MKGLCFRQNWFKKKYNITEECAFPHEPAPGNSLKRIALHMKEENVGKDFGRERGRKTLVTAMSGHFGGGGHPVAMNNISMRSCTMQGVRDKNEGIIPTLLSSPLICHLWQKEEVGFGAFRSVCAERCTT